MSCEESYLAISRYLSDEQQPYAAGTPGNTKRKIRKAAACYVMRNGTLFYQRRQKGLDEFTELEVVLQEGRRRELIDQYHVTGGGDHLNQHLTWESLSQKYWWRGILKQVKDYIRDCPQCQSRLDRRSLGDDGPRPVGRPSRRRAMVHLSDEEEEEEEEGDQETDGSFQKKILKSKTAAKHELVFVDSKGIVKQFLPRHSQTMLDKLNQQRLANQFCDITLLIEGEEHRAHKAVLAACSDYFKELFVEKGAVSTHEAVVDLSGFTKSSFLPLLDFAYTSQLSFNFCVMAEVATLARHLLMSEVLQICESVHKQVEEQKLMVYQRGDIHTVVSSQPAPPQAFIQESGAYMVTIQSDGQAVVTHTGVGVSGESLAVVAQPGETVTLIAHGGETEEGGTMTVVTHSGQAGASESLAVVSACLALEQTPEASMEPGAFLINVDPETPSELGQPPTTAPPAGPEEATQATPSQAETDESHSKGEEPVASAPAPPPAMAPPPKRKRGRPAKVKVEEVEEEEEVVEEQVSAPVEEVEEEVQGGPYRRRLRQRSMGEGGYVRLHMGLEEEEESKAPTAQRATTPKVGQRLVKRGRPPKRRIEEEVGEGGPAAGAGEEPSAGEGVEPPQTAPSGPEQEVEAGAPAPQGPGQPEGAADGEHTCSECGMTFQRRYALIMHTLKHEKARGYKCSLCSKDFQYAASLRAHLARHKQQKAQRPPVARASQDDEGLEGEGEGGARVKREFVCDICGKTLPKLYSLRIHMLNHTGVRPHLCRVCGKSFAHKHSLKMHRVLHDAAKQFHCVLCDKSFVSKRSLEEHTSIHTGESKYLCVQCGRSFHRASGLSKHLKRHQPKPDVRGFSCDHCDKSFYEAKDLQQHMNKHLGLKPFQCQVCGKCYSWKKDWYSHVKSHSVAEPYRCNVCGKEFFEKALFRRHVKKATHGKKGRVKQNLERECEHCGRKFTQLREYRRHINNHQGVKPFECLTCGVAWADARSLKRHVRTHTGERPYVCPMCQEAHIDARTLRKHMTKYHGDQLPGKIMLEKDTLQFHNQGTQVEHAVSILASDLPPELRPAHTAPAEEIETVLITEETVEAVQAVEAVSDASLSTLSDQSIMQVVNYVLAQKAVLPAGGKLDDSPQELQTMEVEVAHVAEVE